MRWFDKPLSPVAQALVLVAIAGLMIAFEKITGTETVLIGFPIPVRYVAWTCIGIGALRLAAALLRKPATNAPLPSEQGARRDDPPAPRRTPGAPTRIACRTCGELVDATTLEDRECAICRRVGVGSSP